MQQSDLRAIRSFLGKPKMNDLVLCIIGGALRRYLSSKGELPDKTLLTICPINVRGSGNAGEGGNHVTAMRVALGTDIDDPVERLKMIAASSVGGKDQAEKFGGSFFGDLLALYPFPIRSALMRGAVSLTASGSSPIQLANTMVTNIPNPAGTYYFAGSKVLAYAGFGPITPGYGLFHTVTGMEWEMSVSVTSCREIMPDVATYIDCIREEFERLRSLVPSPSAPVAAQSIPI